MATPVLAQCGETTIHPAHPWEHPLGGVEYECPGLDADVHPEPAPEVPTTGPLSVECTECRAPAGVPCHSTTPGAVHQDRRRLADLLGLERGTCALCGQLLVRGSVLGGPVEVWHPHDEAFPPNCPPLPDPRTDWNAYAEQINAGARPGYPGTDNFIPAGA